MEVPLALASDQEDPITEISLERTRCYGPCPIYKLVLRRDGRATFIGKENVKRIGEFRARISKEDFDHLAQFLVSRGFFGLKNEYTAGRMVQDIPSVITSVVRGRERKTVKHKTISDSDQKAVPAELIEIEKAIDAALEPLQWEKH